MLTITFKPSKKQFEAWEYLTDKTTTELGYGGAASGGKSYLECFWVLSMAIAYPDTGWLLGRKELNNLKRTTLLTFFKVCAEYGIKPGLHFNYNQQTNIITFTNKSQIFLFDLSHQPSDPLYTRLGGLELTGAAIDESNEVPVEAIQIVTTRLGRRNNETYGLPPKLLETFNPDKGHVYSRYYKPWKEGSLPSHRKFIKALPKDNPYTTEEYIRQLENADKKTKERLLFGNFEYDDDPNTLMEYDAIMDLFTNTVPPSAERYMVVDVARYGQDKTIIDLWKGMKRYRTVEYTKQGLDVTSEAIRSLAISESVPYSHIIIDEVGVGGGVVDTLRGVKGFIANAAAMDVVGRKQNFKNLKAQCSYLLAEKVNRHEIAIHVDNAKDKDELVEELEQIKARNIDAEGKLDLISKEDVKAMIGRSPDRSDAIMMRIYFELVPERRGSATVHRPDYANTYTGRKPTTAKVHAAR